VFAYIERIFDAANRPAAVRASIATLDRSLLKLREAGFQEMVIEDSYEIVRDLINGIVDSEQVSNNGSTLTPAQLYTVFQDDSSTSSFPPSPLLPPLSDVSGFSSFVGWSSDDDDDDDDATRSFVFAVSNYLVTFMRMITSAQIRGNPDEYEAFLTHPDTGETIDVTEFCETVVEVLGKEAG
jgi:ubiquitin thioesterase protein OTUB1